MIFVANRDLYKAGRFILSIDLQYGTSREIKANDCIVSTRTENYCTDYTRLEFNSANMGCFDYREILENSSFDFKIISLQIPKLLTEVISQKVSCYIAFHQYHIEKREFDYINEQCEENSHEERMTNIDYGPNNWDEDPFDEAPGWQWNID